MCPSMAPLLCSRVLQNSLHDDQNICCINITECDLIFCMAKFANLALAFAVKSARFKQSLELCAFHCRL